MAIGLASRDEADHVALASVAVTDNQSAKCRAEAKKNETVLCFRVLGVIDEKGVFVRKHSLRLLEGDAMLALIKCLFRFVPLEA